MRLRLLSLPTFAAVLALLCRAAADEGFKSGPAVGDYNGGAFQAYNVNGKKAAGRPHCLVCEFGNDPVIAVFVREGDNPADKAIKELFDKMDDLVKRHSELSFLHAFAIFVTPHARSSITEKKIEGAKELVEDAEARNEAMKDLIKEAVARGKAIKRVEEFAKPLERVVLGLYPPDNLPAAWKLSKEPGVTVVLYAKQRVLVNLAFPEGKLTSPDVEAFGKVVDDLMKQARRKKKLPG